MYKFLCGHYGYISFGYISRNEISASYGNFVRNYKPFSKPAALFYIPTSTVWESSSFTSLLTPELLCEPLEQELTFAFFSVIIIVFFKISLFLNCILNNCVRKYKKETYLNNIVRNFPEEMTFKLIPEFVDLGSIERWGSGEERLS